MKNTKSMPFEKLFNSDPDNEGGSLLVFIDTFSDFGANRNWTNYNSLSHLNRVSQKQNCNHEKLISNKEAK